MKNFLFGLIVALGLIGGAAWYVWNHAPEWLPVEWRRENPHSRDYAPVVYRWRDAQGVLQLTDTPPRDRPYETVRIDPDTNVVPDTLPRSPRN